MNAGTLEGAPIELKDAEVDPAEIVTKALAELEKNVGDRLAALETKSADTARLDRIEAALNRRGTAPVETKAADLTQKAFFNFVRHGVERVGAEEQKALVVATGSAGGYLAPPEFGAELIKLLVQYSPIRQYARVVTANAGVLKYPRRVSSLTASWVDETEDRPESEPTFEQISISPFELATFVPFSVQLLEDQTYDIEGELAAEFAEQFGVAEGAAFVSGTGVGQPKGLLTATGIKTVTTGAAAGFPASNPADVLIGVFHELPAVHANNGVWLANRKTIGLMRTWKDGTGRYLLLDPVSAGAPSTLLGRPVVECVDMPDVAANATPIVFGDMQGFRIVDRVQPQFLRDPYTLAGKGQVLIRGRKRVGADVTHPDRFVKLKVAA
jgi:HK97 family phage major capsid protein